MSAKSSTVPVAKLYEEDFLAWTEETVRLLRGRQFSELDLDNLIEEIDSMSKSQWRELDNRLVVVLKHLLKWRYQPEGPSPSWESTLLTQRRKLDRLLRQSPSLKPGLREAVVEPYRDAAKEAGVETRLPASTFPDRCPFTAEQILDPDFLP
jgi:hypothetical protein